MIRAKSFIAFFLFTTMLCAHEQPCRLALRHIEGGGIGYSKGYTTVEGFFSTGPGLTFMPFLDLRGHIFNNGKAAINVGAGLRKIGGSRVYGINTYYDYRTTQTRIHYNQVGFGFETLGKLFDVRLNGYLPLGKKALSSPATFAGFSGNAMMLAYEVAMKGFNAELSFHCGQLLSKSPSFDLYAGAGPYYFTQKNTAHIWGGKVRVGCKFNEYVRLELRNSYDKTFRNKFQCELTLSLPFGKGSSVEQKDNYAACALQDFLFSRMLQPVERQEIIVVKNEKTSALDPATGQPYNFVFVDNTSHSKGTYESPYPTLALAQENSNVRDIIYVFPGDGTTKGMDVGITLQNNQKFWGSGIDQSIATTQGTISIPAQSSSAPTITNIDIDTTGDGITLATVNQVKGFTITQVLNNGISGTNVQNIDVSHCLIDSSVFAIDAACDPQATVSVTNSTIQGVNGINLNFSGPATASIIRNTFTNITSVSEAPLAITAGANPLIAVVQNNTISGNTCGGIHFILNDTNAAQLMVTDNIITNNGTGARASLGSPLLINPNNTTSGNCSLTLTNNTFLNNVGPCLYCSNGSFNNFTVNANGNTLTDNGDAGFVFANACNTFGLTATNNTIANGNDHGISTASGITIIQATMNITNNQITGNTSQASGIALNHEGTNLTLLVANNNLSNNEGSGIILYSSGTIGNVASDIEDNTINNNQNVGAINMSGGIDLEQYATLSGLIANNTLSNNATGDFYTGSTAVASPSMCLTMNGNTSTMGYAIANNGAGAYNLAPCNYATVNTGTFNLSGTITPVQSCPDATPCP